jgi:hypothetical protein
MRYTSVAEVGIGDIEDGKSFTYTLILLVTQDYLLSLLEPEALCSGPTILASVGWLLSASLVSLVPPPLLLLPSMTKNVERMHLRLPRRKPR